MKRILLLFAFISILSGCQKEFVPKLSTNTVTNVTDSTAISGGNITGDGGAIITAQGVCWSTTYNPTVTSNKTVESTEISSFTSNLSGLKPNTAYYVRAYATNSVGTGYGDQIEFNTLAKLARVTTTKVTDITASTAKSGGEVIDDGGVIVTASGLVWSTNENPTIEDNKGYTVNDNSTGTFISILSGLEFSTTYYVRSYASNKAGTGYGNQYTFTTLDGIKDIEGNIYSVVTIGSQTWMAENLKTTKYNDGSDIPNITDANIWSGINTPAYCWWKNQASLGSFYGALYNWYTVGTGKLCPNGWHVPTDGEWYTLESYIGTDVGNKLKATSVWDAGSNGTDVYGFKALPGSYRSYDGTFNPNFGSDGYWWSSTKSFIFGDIFAAWYRRINAHNEMILRDIYGGSFGLSIRCVKD